MSATAGTQASEANGAQPGRCVVVVDEALPAGLLANATGVLALTLGSLVQGLPGPALVDADGEAHPGLIPQGITVLCTSSSALGGLREQATSNGELLVVDFPADGQQTNDYEEFRRRVADSATAELSYLAILIYGPRRAVARITGSLPLLRAKQ